MNEKEYFLKPSTITQKQYEALRAFFLEELPAKDAAEKFGYTFRAFTSLVADFRKKLRMLPGEDPFFLVKKPGRKELKEKTSIVSKVVQHRKKYLSVPDIKVDPDGKDIKGSLKKLSNYKARRVCQVAKEVKQRKTVSGTSKNKTGNQFCN